MKNLSLFPASIYPRYICNNEVSFNKEDLGGKAEWAKQQLKDQTNDFLEELQDETLTVDEVISLLDTSEAKNNWNKFKDTPKNSARYVIALQAGLKMLSQDPGKIDALYGGNTRNAVIAFQKAEGLTADGAPGPITIGKLLEKLNEINLSEEEEAEILPTEWDQNANGTPDLFERPEETKQDNLSWTPPRFITEIPEFPNTPENKETTATLTDICKKNVTLNNDTKHLTRVSLDLPINYDSKKVKVSEYFKDIDNSRYAVISESDGDAVYLINEKELVAANKYYAENDTIKRMPN